LIIAKPNLLTQNTIDNMKSLLFFIFFLTCFNYTFSQEKNLVPAINSSDYEIFLTHKENEREHVIFIDENQQIRIRLKGWGKNIKGQMTAIDETTITIDNVEYDFKEIETIETISKKRKSSGAIVMGSTVIPPIIGIYLLSTQSPDLNIGSGGLVTLFLGTLAAIVVSFGTLAIGTGILTSAHKRYTKERWNMEIRLKGDGL